MPILDVCSYRESNSTGAPRTSVAGVADIAADIVVVDCTAGMVAVASGRVVVGLC